MEEGIQKLFFKEVMEEVMDHLDVILKHLALLKDTVKISSYELDIDDILKKQDDPTYLKGKGFQLTEQGVEFLYPFPEIFALIKDSIPRNISTLEVDYSWIKDQNYLENFPKLTTYINSSFSIFSEKDLEYFQKSHIERVISSSLSYDYRNLESDDYEFIKPHRILLYQDVLFLPKEDLSSFKSDELEIYVGKMQPEKIEKIYQQVEHTYPKVFIKDCKERSLKLAFSSKEIEQVTFKNQSPGDVYQAVSYFFSHGYSIKNIVVSLENKDYPDIKMLSSISKKCPLEIDYQAMDNASYEEFIAMRETLNYYKELILQEDLSPVEKGMYAYNLLKTFEYRKSENSSYSRDIHHVINTGKIVCVGYSLFLTQLLREVGVAAASIPVDCSTKDGKVIGHERTLVLVDDEEYDIHGIYAMDATWDSNKNNQPSVDSYQYFMIPPRDYPKIFPKDSIPPLFLAYLNNEKEFQTEDFPYKESYQEYMMKKTIQALFGYENISEEVREYLDCKGLSPIQFKSVLKRVKLAMGYSLKDLSDITYFRKDMELNRMLNESGSLEKEENDIDKIR